MAKLPKDNYSKLHEISKMGAILGSINSLLEWDHETYMPQAANGLRSLQVETMASLVHRHKTSPKFIKALSLLINLESGEIIDENLSDAQKAALREWRRDHLHTIKLPLSFVKAFAKTTSHGIHSWAKAKKHNNFKEFLPHLEKIVSLNRKKADYLGYKEHPYDALLDLYEPEMKVSTLIPLFAKLKLHLTALLQSTNIATPIRDDFLTGHFSHAKQMHFGQTLMAAMGFDESRSRLDLSNHPFCITMHPKDVRLTTRIRPDLLMSNIFAVIHEGGHGLYGLNLPEEHYGSPLCEPISLGIDESQSRWWETRIGHSLPFWKHFFPSLKEQFPEALGNITLDEFYRAINTVKAGLIRIEADEITYSLHVIIRFEIEKALIEGSLKAKEIPGAWNELMREYLGISPHIDSEGCLQDIHWAMGAIGYFPTYTLGNLYAAQFFNRFEKEHANWKDKVAQGDLGFVRHWLKENIHQYGRQFTPQQMIQKVTGQPLSEQPYIDYLENKYKAIYQI